MQELIGTGVALVTPFKKDFSIDVDALIKLVNFQVENNINYIVILGTTAENATLDKDEKDLVIQTIIKANSGRIPLVLGVGGNDTRAVINDLKTIDLSPFIAVLSVSPYYNKPTQEGIYQHFAAIAKASPIPIILYNVPGRTSSNMLPETVIRLANDYDNIVAIKEASGDIVQAMKIIEKKPKNFLVISGDDMITLAMILAGGSGVISVIGEGFPKQFSKMVQLGLERKVDEAYEIHYQLAESIDLIFEQGNPAGVKEIHQYLGLSENIVRLPLVNVNENLKNRIHNFVNKIAK